MNTENKNLMRSARESLTGKWGLAIGVGVVYALLNGGIQYKYHIHGAHIQLPVFALLLGGPMMLGMAIFSLHISREQEARFEQLFEGFKTFKTAFVAYFIMMITIVLLSFLLIIPGIIAALNLAMTFFIIADNRTIDAMEALSTSRQMMDGYKMKLLRLGFRFFGLALLCVLTLGIGFFWFVPFVHVTMAKFYEDIKDQNMAASFDSGQ